MMRISNLPLNGLHYDYKRILKKYFRNLAMGEMAERKDTNILSIQVLQRKLNYLIYVHANSGEGLSGYSPLALQALYSEQKLYHCSTRSSFKEL